MWWSLFFYFFILVALEIQQLEAKLALELSRNSSDMLGNTIYHSNYNEILDEVEDIIQLTSMEEQKLRDNFNDVKVQGKLQDRMEPVEEPINGSDKNDAKGNFLPSQFSKEMMEKYKSIKTAGPTMRKTIRTTMKPIPVTVTATKSSINTKMQRPTSFINPFGQLNAFFGGDQFHYFQDYSFLFNAEKHTIFRLHTSIVKNTTSSTSDTDTGRVLNTVVSGSLSAALGVSSTNAAGVPPTKVEEVQLYNAVSLRQSRFNPFNPTRILIHGWFGGSHAGVYNTLVPEYLKLENGTYNIFTVDWGRGAIADYITASYRVKPVGKVVAKFIDFLHRESGMRFEDLHVIGFSMGAHIAGIAGKFVQTGRLPIIYALDPALPLFRYENIDERIALTDADYVEVIHTSVGTYGYDSPLGHVDFYLNYGSGQPGCFFNECSHFRAFQVLAESLHNPNAFRGQGCDVKLWLDMIRNRRCLMGTGRNLTMGGNPTDAVALRKRGGGVYYMTTNASPPYGRG